MKSILFHSITAALLALVLSGCGGLREQIMPAPEGGEKIVEMKAASFSFEPNNLKVSTGDTLVFRIENISGISHNFTLTGPDGAAMESVTLPSGEVTEVKAEFNTTGIYRFHCDKPFHNTMGMQGRVVVAE